MPDPHHTASSLREAPSLRYVAATLRPARTRPENSPSTPPIGSPRTDSKEGRRQLAYLLQDELLILRDSVLAEMHGENVRSCLHGDAGLWLVGVIAYFLLGRVLEELKTEQPICTSYCLMWKEGTWGDSRLEEILIPPLRLQMSDTSSPPSSTGPALLVYLPAWAGILVQATHLPGLHLPTLKLRHHPDSPAQAPGSYSKHSFVWHCASKRVIPFKH